MRRPEANGTSRAARFRVRRRGSVSSRSPCSKTTGSTGATTIPRRRFTASSAFRLLSGGRHTYNLISMKRGSLLLLFVCVSVYSQGTNATLEGQVTDPSGGVIAGAVVKAISANTGFTQIQTTTNAGAYHLSLP